MLQRFEISPDDCTHRLLQASTPLPPIQPSSFQVVPLPRRPQVIDTTFALSEGAAGLQAALDRISAEAEAAVDAGFSFLVLSDRGFGPGRVPVSCLLAAGRVHHHLVDTKKRSRVGLAVETGARQPRRSRASAPF